MSVDIIVLRPADQQVNDLADVESVNDIGPITSVTQTLEHIFPGCINGVFAVGEAYSLEAQYSGDPVASIHLTLRIATDWSDAAQSGFLQQLHTLCRHLDALAFAVSDNSLIEFTSTSRMPDAP